MSEITNQDRARWARAAVHSYHDLTRHDIPYHPMDWSSSDPEGEDFILEVVGDLVCDLGHLAAQSGVSFDALVEWARRHYQFEEAEEYQELDQGEVENPLRKRRRFTMSAVATIEKDHLDGSYEGHTFGDATLSAGAFSQHFALIDDDDIVYYEGTILATDEESADELAEALWHWGAADSGTVTIKVDGVSLFG